MELIPFNRPYVSGMEQFYLEKLFKSGDFAENGIFDETARKILMELTETEEVFLTSSGTAALELMCMTAGLKPGDEVILPSFTYPSSANAILRTGAVPVFVDIRRDTFNLDQDLMEKAISGNTKAVMPVHYGGVACEMESILDIADRCGLFVLEDAAQGIDSYYKSRHLGTMGQMGALSFHETKNIHCGQGGALLINRRELIPGAEIFFENGTNRRQFFRGESDQYSWKNSGSSFALSGLSSAFLCAQLEKVHSVTEKRLIIWDRYHDIFEKYEKEGFIRRPIIPGNCRQNGHCYPLLFPSGAVRNEVRDGLSKMGVMAHSHYVSLHSSSMGRRISSEELRLPVTGHISNCLLRMPLYVDIDIEECSNRIDEVFQGIFERQI